MLIKNTKGQTLIYKTIHIRLHIELHELHKKQESTQVSRKGKQFRFHYILFRDKLNNTSNGNQTHVFIYIGQSLVININMRLINSRNLTKFYIYVFINVYAQSNIRMNVLNFRLMLWCLTSLSTIFQLYRGCGIECVQ